MTSDSDPPPGGLGLADFISDLREELSEAQRRAAENTTDSLRLMVGPVELSLEVAYTVERSGKVGGGVKAKFWVFEFGEASAEGSAASTNVRSQHLKLTLTPRLERAVRDEHGQVHTVVGDVDVSGRLESSEAPVVMPPIPDVNFSRQ